jgi:K+-transporting ATPase ATPase B chain
MHSKKANLWQRDLIIRAIKDSVYKLDPRTLWRNPVMFVVEMGAVLSTLITIADAFTGGNLKLDGQISLWLWFTILFANFAESLAEGRGRAQSETLRQSRSEAHASKLQKTARRRTSWPWIFEKVTWCWSGTAASSPVTARSSRAWPWWTSQRLPASRPVVREAGGSLCGVTGGTKVLSGEIKVCITSNPGETFLDQMIGMVESAKRQKTPNEQALEILLLGLTGLFIVVVVTLQAFAGYSGLTIAVPVLLALLVCLMPTTIGGLLPAIGIAGMDRLLQHNVIALSGRAVEASGDVDVVLMDKTGTITLGNRMATEFLPTEGVSIGSLAEAAMLSSLADETPEGRSIVDLAKVTLGVRGRDIRTRRVLVYAV